MIRNILIGIMLSIAFIQSAIADNFTGVTICNDIHESFVITCNGHSAPPVLRGICLPATWKAMATVPLFFGGTKEAPITHFTCQWVTERTGKQVMSTVMDIYDDNSGNYPSGMVTNVVVNNNYIAYTNPNPLPQDYVPSISVLLKRNN